MYGLCWINNLQLPRKYFRGWLPHRENPQSLAQMTARRPSQSMSHVGAAELRTNGFRLIDVTETSPECMEEGGTTALTDSGICNSVES